MRFSNLPIGWLIVKLHGIHFRLFKVTMIQVNLAIIRAEEE